MIPFLFFIFALLLGILVIHLLRIDFLFEEKIGAGIILGSVLITFWCFLLGIIAGFSKTAVLLSLLSLSVLVLVLTFKYRRDLLKSVSADYRIFKNRKKTLFIILLGISILFFSTLWPKVLFEKNNDIFTIGTAGVWGDWSAHSAYISHFAYSDKISLENPIFEGKKFSYTFMVDFLSAILIKLGADWISSMTIPGFVFSLAFVILLYSIVFRLTKKESVAFLTIFLFVLGGGFGFIYFFQDLSSSPSVSMRGFLSTSLREYTNINEYNIHWTGFLNSLFLAQRALTMGLPFGIFIMLLLILAIEKKEQKLFLVAGLLSSLLPTIHMHTLVAISVIAFFSIIFSEEKMNFNIVEPHGLKSFDPPQPSSGGTLRSIPSFAPSELRKGTLYAFIHGLKTRACTPKCVTARRRGFLRRRVKKLLLFFCPLALLGIPQALFIFPSGGSNLKIQLGWMAGNENWLFFWIKNLGLYFLLLPIAFLTLDKRLKIVYLIFFSLFIASNLIIFQPYDYDNIKILNYWFLMTAVVIAYFLIWVWQKNLFGKITVMLIVPVLVLSSFLDLLHLYYHPGFLLLREEEVNLATKVREKTAENSVFLTSDLHNHFIPTLTGRQIVMGYRGWLWTYGIDYREREKDVLKMFQGGSESRGLLKQYGVDYVVIGPSEIETALANKSYFDNNYPVVMQSDKTAIYQIINPTK